MCRTMLVVVLYDEIYNDSLTLNSMMNKEFSDVDLMIVNHGPDPLEFDKGFIHTLGFFVRNIILKEFLDERTLSAICNDIINDYSEYDRFIFFDGNTSIGKKYVKSLDVYHENSIDLQIPNIRARDDRKVYFPVIDGAVCKRNDGESVNYKKELRSLGTGLVIYSSLITKFKTMKIDVFHSSFTFKGDNCGFFSQLDAVRLKTPEVTVQIVNTVTHSVFRTERPSNKLRVIDRIREGLSSIKI